jgi:competence protein ComEA
MRDERAGQAPFEIDPLSVVPSAGQGLRKASRRSSLGLSRVVPPARSAVAADNRGTSMTVNRVILSALAFALVSVPALAQDNKGPSTTPAPAVTAPSTTGKATAPVAAKVNLNTASAADLNKLPKGNVMNSKAIVDARTKAKFKNWDDFVARKVVPADAAAAIKDVATF